MKYIVCTNYCGADVELGRFDTQYEAKDFASRPYVMFYADEMENGTEDEVIYPSEMWIEESTLDDLMSCDDDMLF